MPQKIDNRYSTSSVSSPASVRLTAGSRPHPRPCCSPKGSSKRLDEKREKNDIERESGVENQLAESKEDPWNYIKCTVGGKFDEVCLNLRMFATRTKTTCLASPPQGGADCDLDDLLAVGITSGPTKKAIITTVTATPSTRHSTPKFP